jgi:hypothetical protein
MMGVAIGIMMPLPGSMLVGLTMGMVIMMVVGIVGLTLTW